MATTSRITHNGHEYDFNAAVNLMDDELREELHSSRDWSAQPEADQAFFDAYAAAHQRKFGEEFRVD